jgi:pantoate--beta-alanine ligase
LEGQFRPGHFDGVGIVVTKLLNQVGPDRAYFGLKDLQQFLLVKRLVSDLSIPVEIIGADIVREPNGLAMSSRNERLSLEGRETASKIYAGLQHAQEMLNGGSSVDETKMAVLAFYRGVEGLKIEYLEFVNPSDLSECSDRASSKDVAVCVAAFVEGIRLIDNLYLRQD